jgi:VWFA-related protein
MMKAMLVCVVAWGMLGTLPAQEPSPAPVAAQADKITVRVDLVNVLMTVTNKKNHLETGLGKDDFRVFEDNQPQTISYFSRETNLPLRIGVLIDTSSSIRDRLRFEQEAVIDFLNTTLRHGKDSAFVLAFDVQPQVVQDYTDDIEKLSKAIRGLLAGGVTTLYDAIYTACHDKLLVVPPGDAYVRRVMIIASDGQDIGSDHSREEALTMAQHAEVTIYAISTGGSEASGGGDKVLRRLAEQTGGRAFFPFKASDTTANFREIARELRSQYSLAYVPTNKNHDGTFRNITIQTLQSGLLVRARPGYFAPAE